MAALADGVCWGWLLVSPLLAWGMWHGAAWVERWAKEEHLKHDWRQLDAVDRQTLLDKARQMIREQDQDSDE